MGKNEKRVSAAIIFFAAGIAALILRAEIFAAKTISQKYGSFSESLHVLSEGAAYESDSPEKAPSAPAERAAAASHNYSAIPIVMYHKIRDIDPYDSERTQQFVNSPLELEKQLKLIKELGYQTVFAKDLGDFFDGKAELPPKPIVLTFDDGSYDFYINAFPLLKKYNMRATVYMIVNYLDKYDYLTTAQIKDLSNSDLIEIAAHTLSHPHLTKYGTDSAEYEILESKKKLEEVTGETVWSFSYPYGLYNDMIKEFVQRSGYTTAVTVNPDCRQSAGKRYELYRFPPTDAFFKLYVR